jgi:hypothetical protein
MKKVLLVSMCLFFWVFSFAQRNNLYFYWPLNSTSQKIDFAETVFVNNSDAATLTKIAEAYLKYHFKSERDTIVTNPSTNEITCKGVYIMSVPELGQRGEGFVSFTLTLTTYKNAYRYSLSNLEHHPLNDDDVSGGPLEREKSLSGYLFPKKYWDELKRNCFNTIATTLEGLKETMIKQAKENGVS